MTLRDQSQNVSPSEFCLQHTRTLKPKYNKRAKWHRLVASLLPSFLAGKGAETTSEWGFHRRRAHKIVKTFARYHTLHGSGGRGGGGGALCASVGYGRGVGRSGAPSFLAGRVKTATERGARRNRDQGNSVLDVDGAWGHSPALPLDSLRRWDRRRGGGRESGVCAADEATGWLRPRLLCG